MRDLLSTFCYCNSPEGGIWHAVLTSLSPPYDDILTTNFQGKLLIKQNDIIIFNLTPENRLEWIYKGIPWFWQ